MDARGPGGDLVKRQLEYKCLEYRSDKLLWKHVRSWRSMEARLHEPIAAMARVDDLPLARCQDLVWSCTTSHLSGSERAGVGKNSKRVSASAPMSSLSRLLSSSSFSPRSGAPTSTRRSGRLSQLGPESFSSHRWWRGRPESPLAESLVSEEVPILKRSLRLPASFFTSVHTIFCCPLHGGLIFRPAED